MSRPGVRPGIDDDQGSRPGSSGNLQRTFSNWRHQQGIPAKDIAELMGYADVAVQFIGSSTATRG
jgi:hypothetical protein